MSTLTKFGICLRPFRSGFHVLFNWFLTAIILEIKVDNNVIERWFDIVQLSSVYIRQSSSYLGPPLNWCFISVCVLCWLVNTVRIKDRFEIIHNQRQWLFFLHLYLEMICNKPRIPTSDSSLSNHRPFFKVMEVVLDFFAETILGQLVFNQGWITILLIHLVSLVKRYAVLFLEGVITIFNKVKEHVGLQHHLDRTICYIVVTSHFAINF